MHQSLNFHISVSQLPDDVGASPIDIARAYMLLHLQGDNDRHVNMTSSPFQQSQTPVMDSPQVENLKAFEGLFSGERKNIETGGTSGPSEFLIADSKKL
ncbi:hypothetical protein NC653_015873 [Populus alba x Populus x berolinensis]|uniref:Uncharacterized protein n=1 Tax=Populus alba x Populus x berolinensis TaxID=444605 RepID=A0AAD6QLG6_9ROSI|nr:hypothetical protein NC653_015873 [Populus alba x Populus x berolinensis]